MTVQEEAQALIEKETHGELVYEMKWRLEKKTRLLNDVAKLDKDMAEIEAETFNLPNRASCLTVSSSNLGFSSYYTTSSGSV